MCPPGSFHKTCAWFDSHEAPWYMTAHMQTCMCVHVNCPVWNEHVATSCRLLPTAIAGTFTWLHLAHLACVFTPLTHKVLPSSSYCVCHVWVYQDGVSNICAVLVCVLLCQRACSNRSSPPLNSAYLKKTKQKKAQKFRVFFCWFVCFLPWKDKTMLKKPLHHLCVNTCCQGLCGHTELKLTD